MSKKFRITNGGSAAVLVQRAASMQHMLRRIADGMDVAEERGTANAKAFSMCKVEQLDA